MSCREGVLILYMGVREKRKKKEKAEEEGEGKEGKESDDGGGGDGGEGKEGEKEEEGGVGKSFTLRVLLSAVLLAGLVLFGVLPLLRKVDRGVWAWLLVVACLLACFLSSFFLSVF